MSVSAAFACVCVLCVRAAFAAEPTLSFDIPSEPVDRAIADFARQSGLQIVAPTRQLHSVMTPALSGDFESRAALRKLIANTGLEISSDSGSQIVLRVAAPAPRRKRPAVGAPVAARPPEPRDDTALDEVVVTAEKRAGSELMAPLALTTYVAADLTENQVHSLADLQNIDPSINVNRGQLGDTITLRGVSTADLTSKGTPNIVFNVDGVPVTRGFEQGEPLFDLERVELLKGPQGTLYGASSTGGALNVISARPQDEFTASTELTVGSDNTRRATVVANAPVTDAIAARLALNYNHHDGYVLLPDGTPYTDGEDNFAGRLSGLFRFGTSSELLLQAEFGRIGGPGIGSVNYDTLLNEPRGAAQRVVYYNPFAQRLDHTFGNLTGQFDSSLGPVHATWVFGHMSFDAREDSSSTNNPLANAAPDFDVPEYLLHAYAGAFRTDSHELRFTNNEPGRLDWIAGANWFRERIQEDDHYWTALQPVPDSYPTTADLVNNGDILNTTLHSARGVFAQATWHLDPRWDLTAGLRETRDALSREGTFAAGPVAGCSAPEPCVGVPNDGSESDSKLTWRGTLAWHASPLQLVYATVASGFKGGGFNDFCGSGPCPYRPEQLVAFEAGYKGRPRDNIELKSDLFYYDYSAMQIAEMRIVNGTSVVFTGSYSAMIEGWDNELTVRPTRSDELHLNVTMLRSGYGDLPTYLPSATGAMGEPVNIEGHMLSATPAVAAALSYAHDLRLTNGATLRAHAQLKYSSSYYEIQIAPYRAYTQSSFTRSNADIRYTSADGRFHVGAYVLNIENALQITNPPADGGGSPANLSGADPAFVSAPRTWGFTVGLQL